MNVEQEAAKIVNERWRSHRRLKKFLITAGIVAGVFFLIAYVFRKFVQLMFPRGVNVTNLYLPRMRRR